MLDIIVLLANQNPLLWNTTVRLVTTVQSEHLIHISVHLVITKMRFYRLSVKTVPLEGE